MTDCGRVHDWINGQNELKRPFKSKTEVQLYVSQNDEQSHSDDTFWPCVDEYDFETELRLLRHTIKRTGTQYYQMHRIDRASHKFLALGLDQNAYREIRTFLGGLDF